MTPSPSQPDPLHKLLAALTDGETTPETFVGLQMRFSEDPAALGYYRRYMRLCAMLEFELATGREQEGDRPEARNGDLPCPILPPSSIIPHILVAPARSFAAVLLSYAFVAVILGAGMLAAWAWQTPGRAGLGSVARDTTRPGPRAANAGRQLLATIAATNNCVWANPHPEREVASGQIILASGLLEITYSSGAKVILEGPVSYQVASPNCGYLRQGKLTIRVPKSEARVRVQGSGPVPGGPPLAADFPLFRLYAPNIVLTDQDGELGVWVDSAGASHMQVFHGHADLQLSGQPYEKSSPLGANCWAWVKRAADGHRTVLCGTGEPIQGFARQVFSQPPFAANTKQVGSGVGENFRIYQY